MKKLPIDDDLLQETRDYVAKQMETMKKFGALRPDWDEKQQEQLAVDIAQYPQRLRNMRKVQK